MQDVDPRAGFTSPTEEVDPITEDLAPNWYRVRPASLGTRKHTHPAFQLPVDREKGYAVVNNVSVYCKYKMVTKMMSMEGGAQRMALLSRNMDNLAYCPHNSAYSASEVYHTNLKDFAVSI